MLSLHTGQTKEMVMAPIGPMHGTFTRVAGKSNPEDDLGALCDIDLRGQSLKCWER